MREKHQKQLPILPAASNHPKAKELETISNIIDENQSICNDVLNDLNKGKTFKSKKGAKGGAFPFSRLYFKK